MEKEMLTKESVKFNVRAVNCDFMVLDGCTRGESMIFVFARRGDARMQKRSQK